MPTYVYRRPDGTTFDVFQKISDPALTEDPETGVPVQRVISGGAGLQFKGTGFYLTDYVHNKGDGGEKKKATAESSASDGGSKKKETGKTSPASSPSGTSSPSAADD